MDYDFGGLCCDQLDKLEKRLESLRKAYLKEYRMSLNIINSTKAHEKREQIMIEIDDVLRDEINKSNVTWTRRMNEVQNILGKYL
jgi:hypothetical protein